MAEWRDIASAPKDFTYVLVTPGARVPVTVGVCEHECWSDELEEGDPIFPTHWMPLPEPPSKRDRPWVLAQLALTAVVFGLVVPLGIKVTNGRERIEASRAEADFDCRYTSGLCYVSGVESGQATGERNPQPEVGSALPAAHRMKDKPKAEDHSQRNRAAIAAMTG